MQKLRRWMKVVGSLFVLNGVLLIVSYYVRPIGEASGEERVPGADLTSPLYDFAMETWLMFGLEMLVVGGSLWFFSRAPWASRALVLTVLALEVVRGIIDDISWIVNGYPPGFYVGWIVFHIVVIVTGVRALQAAQVEADERSIVPVG